MFGTSTATTTVEYIMLDRLQYDVIYGLLLGLSITIIIFAMKGRQNQKLL